MIKQNFVLYNLKKKFNHKIKIFGKIRLNNNNFNKILLVLINIID